MRKKFPTSFDEKNIAKYLFILVWNFQFSNNHIADVVNFQPLESQKTTKNYKKC